MSCYQRRRSDGATRRWDSRGKGTWHDVPPDEPETLPREVNKGMIVMPVDEFRDGPLLIPIADILASLTDQE